METIDFDELGLDYGANKEIKTDAYDKDLAVKCTNGTYVGTKVKDVLAWKGIPFAKPPVGKLRFKAPERPDDNDLVFEAYNYGKKPIWITNMAYGAFSDANSEDCLYLNVLTGDDSIPNKPVMVWIHGGAFTLESASDPDYRGEKFVKEHPDIVLVTIEYRLGAFGFTNFDDVEGSEEFKGAVNNGIKDQIMALRWINENIEGFGGDKNNITIFGESAGSISAALLPIIDDAKGLFQKSIPQSGCTGQALAQGSGKEPARVMCELFNAKNMDDLQKVDIKDILSQLGELAGLYAPVCDGDLIPLDTYQAYRDGKASDVKIMTGYLADECRFFLNFFPAEAKSTEEDVNKAFLPWMKKCLRVIEDKMTDEEKKIAEEFIAGGDRCEALNIEKLMSELCFGIGTRNLADTFCTQNDAYLYYFAYPTFGEPDAARHAAENPVVFMKDYPHIFRTENFADLQKHVGEVWTSFAKTGVPTVDGIPVKKYSEQDQTCIIFDADGKTFVKDNYLTERNQMLKPLIRHELFSICTNFPVQLDDMKELGVNPA